MRHAVQVVAMICAFTLFALPLAADVIPTTLETEQNRRDRAAVTARLAELGLTGSRAREQADRMTVPVASYFASHPASLQVVAGLHAEELLLGVAMLAGLGAIAADTLQNKR